MANERKGFEKIKKKKVSGHLNIYLRWPVGTINEGLLLKGGEVKGRRIEKDTHKSKGGYSAIWGKSSSVGGAIGAKGAGWWGGKKGGDF